MRKGNGKAVAVFAVVNPVPGKCWSGISRLFGACEKNARPGKLTCWWHSAAEPSAQRLKEKGS